MLLLVAGILAWLPVRRSRMLLAVPILATEGGVLGYAVASFAMSGKP